jgi:hypothetical protein
MYTFFSVCTLLCVTIKWQSKVSVNTTNVVLQSIKIQIELCFPPLHVSALMGPSSGIIFGATRPYYKVMPKLECKNYNIDLLKILRAYIEFVLKNFIKSISM